jgi:hypothetical protein
MQRFFALVIVPTNATLGGSLGAPDEVLRKFGSVVKNADGAQETVTIDSYIV